MDDKIGKNRISFVKIGRVAHCSTNEDALDTSSDIYRMRFNRKLGYDSENRFAMSRLINLCLKES